MSFEAQLAHTYRTLAPHSLLPLAPPASSTRPHAAVDDLQIRPQDGKGGYGHGGRHSGSHRHRRRRRHRRVGGTQPARRRCAAQRPGAWAQWVPRRASAPCSVAIRSHGFHACARAGFRESARKYLRLPAAAASGVRFDALLYPTRTAPPHAQQPHAAAPVAGALARTLCSGAGAAGRAQAAPHCGARRRARGRVVLAPRRQAHQPQGAAPPQAGGRLHQARDGRHGAAAGAAGGARRHPRRGAGGATTRLGVCLAAPRAQRWCKAPRSEGCIWQQPARSAHSRAATRRAAARLQPWQQPERAARRAASGRQRQQRIGAPHVNARAMPGVFMPGPPSPSPWARRRRCIRRCAAASRRRTRACQSGCTGEQSACGRSLPSVPCSERGGVPGGVGGAFAYSVM